MAVAGMQGGFHGLVMGLDELAMRLTALSYAKKTGCMLFQWLHYGCASESRSSIG